MQKKVQRETQRKKGSQSKSNCTSTDKRKLALLLPLAGLVEVKEPALCGQRTRVRVALIVELEGVVSVGQVFFGLLFHSVVGGDLDEELGVVFLIEGHGGIVNLEDLVVSSFSSSVALRS